MARRPLPLNTWGEIHVRKVRKGVHEAHGRFRHDDGVTRQHRRTGSGRDTARDNLLDYFRELASEATSELDRDTRWRAICQAWIDDLEKQYAIDGRSPNTPKAYRQTLNKWVLPAMGELRAREVTTQRCDALIQRAARERSTGTAGMVRKVLAAACLYAIRAEAMSTSPVKDAGRIGTGKARKSPVALSLEQRTDLLTQLDAAAVDSGSVVQRMLPDLARMMLATGVRISEVLALSGNDVDLAAQTVTVGHHLVELRGGGVRRMEGRKGGSRALVLGVPEWSVPTWRARKLASGGGPLLPIHDGLWARPGSVTARQSKVMREIGYGWVTSHVWRKTVATVLDEAGLTTTEGADQLGNTPAVFEKHYRAPRQSNAKAAEALNKALKA